MVISALARLRHRSTQLKARLTLGSATDVASAREMLRLSLVELYELGYWREHPNEFRIHMQMFRAQAATRFNGQPSTSGLGRTDQCSP